MTAGLALAKSGWRVRVHERSPELREIGAGLYLKENSLRVLERLGVFDEVAAHGVRLERMDIHDVDRDRWLIREVSQLRVYNVVRTALHRTLAQAAVARGAELLTSSTGVHAEPSGRLRLASGETVTADLVVGADGIYSKIRESVRLGRVLRILPEGGTKLLVKRTEAESKAWSVEHWSGKLRMLTTPCSATDTYVALMGPESDKRASTVPIDKRRWSNAFPNLSDIVGRMGDKDGVHHTNVKVETRGWVSGKVAIVGDAAHGQPPNLGQGAGLAIANGLALADMLQRYDTVEEGLLAWEATFRPVAMATQRWSCWYGNLAYRWPTRLGNYRMSALEGINAFPPLGNRYFWLWQGGLPDYKQSRSLTKALRVQRREKA